MTYFPLYQTTCFFIPLVAPCKPLLMNNKKIAFVFSNQIYYISSENDILTVTTVEGVICLRAAVETLTCNQDPFSALVLEIYQTLF